MITIHDVAREAAVSIATVSRVINQPETVSPDTLKRVSAAIKHLGYAPNMIARSLKVKASQTVGIMVSDLTNPFLLRIIKGASRELYAAGFTPVICDTEEDPDKEITYLRNLVERRIDGLIFIPVFQHKHIDRQLTKLNFPLVFVDRHITDDYDCVQSNNQAGISLLFNHLFSLGHRDLALVGGPRQSINGQEREDAYRAMLKHYGMDVQHNPVVVGDFTIEGGYRAARELLAQKVRPRAIVAANNLMGMGVLKAIKDGGLRIPDDIVLVIFDEISELVDPPLTFVRQPAQEMGAEAARLLMGRIRGDSLTAPRLVRFDPVLQVNQSS